MSLVFILSFLPYAVNIIYHNQIMQNKDIAQILENFAPLHLAEDYDNVGLLVGEAEKQVTAVLTSLDINLAVLQEALKKNCNLVVSHHPIWFRSRRSLLGDDFVSEVILFAIRHDISLYACHTNLDNVQDGVNKTIATMLGIKNPQFLLTKANSQKKTQCPAGSGMIGKLPNALSIDAFLKNIKEKFNCSCIRYAPTFKNKIQRVAFCGGAGSFLLQEAINQKADAFLTSDVTYHHFFDSRGQLLYLDIGHYESEQHSPSILARHIQKYLPSLKVQTCELSTNPVCYYY